MKKLLSFCLTVSISAISYAQTNNDIDDAKALIEAYISPLGNSLGAGLNNGWYNTAKPHKLGGFDITLTANLVLIDDDVKNFKIEDIVKGGMFNGNGSSSTILGETNGGEINILEIVGADSTITPIKLPNGLNIPVLPLPMLQAGIGLIKGTELNVRYIPDIKFGKSGKVGVIGFGIKHDILQWLPIVDKAPIDLSLQAGYTKITSSIELIDPNGTITPTVANLDINATTINLLLSKKLLMFTPYVGVGYNSSKTSFLVDEKYNIMEEYIPVEALTELEFETKNNLRANIGFRFNITILALQANYTFSEYPTATLGLGISVR